MSDSLRTLGSAGPRFRRRRKHLGVTLGKLFLYLGIALLLWAFWVTRDSYRMADLIPGEQAYNVYVRNILEKRETLLRSEVWSLLPQSAMLADFSELDADGLGAPDWVLNNLLHDVCQLSGNDLESFSDVLFATRMSRIGTLLERVYDRFSPAERDYAGGLNMRYLPGENLYYAVRGRILLVSRSRDTLIKSLTLQPETAMGEAEFQRAIEEMGVEDIHAHFQLETDTPLGAYLESLRIALMIEDDSAWMGCRLTLSPAFQQQMAPLLEGLQPAQLHEPPPGAITASLNFNRPVDALWTDLHRAFAAEGEEGDGLSAWIAGWQQGVDEEEELPLNQMLSLVFAQVAPEFTLTLVGIDSNEMFPVPEFLLLATPISEAIATLLAGLPEEAETVNPATWTSTPRRSAQTGLVYVPMIGGPAIEPALGIWQDKLLFSTSHRLAGEFMLQQLATPAPVSSPANIYLQINPTLLMNDLFDTGLLLAEIGAIRDHTESSYEDSWDHYLDQADQVEEIAALLAYLNGEVQLDIKLNMAVETP